jgi:hypothetical protein
MAEKQRELKKAPEGEVKPWNPFGEPYQAGPSSNTLSKNDKRRMERSRLNATHLMLQRYGMKAEDLEGEVEELSSWWDKANVWDGKDFLRGMANGVNNFAASNYDLFVHGLFGKVGAPQASAFGWSLDAFGDQKSILGGLASSGVQGVGGFVEGRSMWGFAGKRLKKLSKPKVYSKTQHNTPMKIRAHRAWLSSFAKGMAYSAVGDIPAWHPKQGNLGTTLLEWGKSERWETTNPDLWEFAINFSKDASELYGNVDMLTINTKEWQDKEMNFIPQMAERLKNIPEGMLMGGSIESVLRVWKVKSINRAARKTYEQLDGNLKDLEEYTRARDFQNKWMPDHPAGPKVFDAQIEAAQKEAALNTSKLAVLQQKALNNSVDISESIQAAANIHTSGASISSIRSEVLEGLTKETFNPDDNFLTKWGGDLHRTDLGSVSPEHKGTLLIISPDGSRIVLNDALTSKQGSALVENWTHRLAFEKGAGLEGVPSSRASGEEAEVWALNGIDPAKFYDALVAKGGGQAGGLKLYRQFLEKRARWTVKLASEEGIDLRHLSPYDIRTKHILAKANFNAMVSPSAKGGLDLGKLPNKKSKASPLFHLKSANANTISATGAREMSVEQIRKMLFNKGPLGEPEGLVKLVDDIRDGVKNADGTRKTLHQLSNELGDMVNLETMGGDQDALAFISALAELLPSKLKARKGTTVKSWNDVQFADALGFKTGGQKGAAQKALRENLPEAIDELVRYTGVDREELFAVLSKGNGNFSVSKIIESKKGLDPTDLNIGDIRTLHERIWAFRTGIALRQKAYKKGSEDLLKAYKDGTLTAEIELDYIENLTRLVADMEAMSLVATASGRNLRAFRDIRKNLQDHGLNLDDVKAQQEALLESFGGKEGLVETARAIEDISKVNRIMPHDEFEAALLDAQLMRKASGWGIATALNDIWMNSILSGLKTHAVNNSSVIVKGFVVAGERYAASLLPESFYEKAKDPLTSEPIAPAIAKRMARDASIRQFQYTSSLGLEILKVWLRKGNEDELLSAVDSSGLRTAQEAVDIANLGARSDLDTGKTVGNAAREALLGTGAAQGHATSENIGASIRAAARSVNAKPGFQKWLRDVGDNPKMKALREVWDGFYKHVIRQSARKLVLSDQTFKRLHLSASLEGSLYSYALNIKEMNPKEAVEWAAEIKPQMMMENGDPFSIQGLSDLVRSQASKLGYTGKQHTDYVNAQIHRLTVGKGLLDPKDREKFAQLALTDAEDLVFQTPIDKSLKEVHGHADEAHRKGPKDPNDPNYVEPPEDYKESWAQRISDYAQKNPIMRVFFPFNTTPIHLYRDAYNHLPVLSLYTKEYNADMLSGSPERMSKAYGRQMGGWVLTSTGGFLAANGIISGAGPRDRRDRDAWTQAGKKPYHVNIGKYRIDMARMDPYSIPLRVLADMFEMQQFNEKDPKKAEELKQLYHVTQVAMTEGLINATYMKGLLGAINALSSLTEKDIDEFYDGEVDAVVKHLSSLAVPSVAKSVSGAYDKTMREVRTNWDTTLNRIYPFGVPAKRDPLFGNKILKSSVGGEWWGQVLPMAVSTGESKAFVYNEIQSMAATLGPPAIALRNPNLITTRYYATIAPNKKASAKQMVEMAYNFKAPGGARCSIAKGETFYDFRNKYISKRKVKLSKELLDEIFGQEYNPLTNLRSYNSESQIIDEIEAAEGKTLEIPNITTPFNEKLQELRKDLNKKTGRLVSLQDLTLLLIGSQHYQDTDPSPRIASQQVSARSKLIVNLVAKWREDVNDELLGPVSNLNKGLIDERTGLDLPIVRTYSGMATVFWPDMMRTLSHLEEESKIGAASKGRDPFGNQKDVIKPAVDPSGFYHAPTKQEE